MKNNNTRMIIEGGIALALAQILSYITIITMPSGGSITAGSMVPIILFAMRWGFKRGVLAGVVYGILQFVLGPKYSFHPVSLILDYPAAFGILGISGLFKKNMKGIIAGVFFSIAGRFICHWISGATVFASYAPQGQHPFVYSALYNGSYLIPEFIITVIITVPIIKSIGFITRDIN